MILRGNQCGNALSIAENEEGNLVALQALFDDHAHARLANHFSGKHFSGGGRSFVFCFADHHALACRQSVGFHHHGSAEAGEFMLDFGIRSANRVMCSGNMVALQELLCESLA